MKNRIFKLFVVISMMSLAVASWAESEACYAKCSFDYNDAAGLYHGDESNILKASAKTAEACKAKLQKQCDDKLERFYEEFTPDMAGPVSLEFLK